MSETTSKPVVFLAFANDRDDRVNYLRNLPEEARQIREPLQRARRDGLCELVELANATADDIFRVFQDPEYRHRIAVFHYGGHANGYQLLLESADGSPAAADAGGLAAFLGQQQGLQLAFLNGCSTQQQVQGLLEANVAAVIATSCAIDDQVAMQFAKQFYQALAGGATLRTAYNETEAAVRTTSGGGGTRALYFGGATQQERATADRWPWELYVRDGAENVADWSLPAAVGDPLFGLPAIPEQDLPDQPFRHLLWFDREHAAVFFGRGQQIRRLYELVTSPATPPIVLLYGQSGVGKSSMLAAGLIPRLEPAYEVRYLRRSQEDGLLETMRSAFIRAGTSVSINKSVHFSRDWLEAEQRLGKPLIIILDQVEEVFTRPNSELSHEIADLLNELEAMLGKRQRRPQGRLILSFRKEWLAEIEERLAEKHLSRAKIFLERLGRLGVLEAVRGPTSSKRLQNHYGLTVEDGLPQIIADELLADAESAIAPTLQILLTKMWTEATAKNYEHPHFSMELYQHLKRDGILLRDFLNQQIAAFHERYPEAVESGLLLDLVALHTTPLGTSDQCSLTHLQEQYAHMSGALPDLLLQCQDLHLLTVAATTGLEDLKTTRLAHDTLAPLIREQFEESDKPGQRARRILDNRSVDWEGDRQGTPLDAADLKVVERGVSGTRTLNTTEQRLLAASRNLQAKLQRNQKILTIVGTIAAVLIIAAAGVAILKSIEAGRERNNAIAAREEAEMRKQEAEANLLKAREAVDRYFTDVSEDTLLMQPGTQALRKQLLSAAKEFFEDFANRYAGDPQVQDGVAIAYFNLGHISEEVDGDNEAALVNYEKARLIQAQRVGPIRDLLEPGRAGTKQPQVEAEFIAAFGNTMTALGRAHYKSVRGAGDSTHFSAALDEYEQAISVRKLLWEYGRQQSTGSREDVQRLAGYQRRLADANMNLGVLKQSLEDLKIVVTNYNQETDETAIDHFHEAQDLRAELLEELKSDPRNSDQCMKVVRERARGYYNLARLFARRAGVNVGNNIAVAKALAKSGMEDAARAVADYETVIENVPNDFESHRDLAQSFVVYGKLMFDFDDDRHQEGLGLISQAAELAERIATLNPQVISYRELLGWSYDELGVRQKKDLQQHEARESFQKAIRILENCPYSGLAKAALDEARQELASLDNP